MGREDVNSSTNLYVNDFMENIFWPGSFEAWTVTVVLRVLADGY